MSTRVAGLWMTLAAAVLFAISAVLAADVFDAVAPERVAQFRAVLAAVVLLAVAYRRRVLAVARADVALIVLLGASLAGVNVTYYWAIDRLGVGPGTTIQFTAPVVVLAWMLLVEKRKVPAVAWLAGFGAVGGTGLMTGAWEMSVDPLGVAAGIGAALTFAAYLIVGERLGSRLPSLTVLAWGFLVAALIWILTVPVELGDLTAVTWSSLVFIGLAGTAAPFLLEVSALRRIDAGSVGVVATTEPVVGAALAWVFLAQALTGLQVVGGLLTVAAVAIIHLLTSRRAGVPLPPA